jgi:hypothetical protein
MVRCTSCGLVEQNNSSPICESLANRGLQIFLIIIKKIFQIKI